MLKEALVVTKPAENQLTAASLKSAVFVPFYYFLSSPTASSTQIPAALPIFSILKSDTQIIIIKLPAPNYRHISLATNTCSFT